jgi:hypothetical protein
MVQDHDTDREEGHDSNQEENEEELLLSDHDSSSTPVVYKPYRISSDHAEWICQSLLGRAVDQLFPCHICYIVYEAAAELEAHFTAAHPPGLLNR